MPKLTNAIRSFLSLALIGCTTAAGATVLTFDDLPQPTAAFLADYQGFTFGTNDAATTSWSHSAEAGFYYAPHSGSGYAFTDAQFYTGDILEDGQPISRAQPFIFEGAWVSGINQVHYTLYYGATPVYMSSESPELSRFEPMFVASGYTGPVTSVVIAGRQGFFAIDDFTFTSAVPEPSRLAMMALGILALWGARGRLSGRVAAGVLSRALSRT